MLTPYDSIRQVIQIFYVMFLYVPNKIRAENRILFLAFESGSLTGTDESLVDCYKKKRWSVWKCKSTWAMPGKRHQFSRVIVYAGCNRGTKTSV